MSHRARRRLIATVALTTLLGALPAAAAGQALVAAVLPASRSVQVGVPATVFATVINTGSAAATGCTIAMLSSIPTAFKYFSTDAANTITSGENPVVAIGPGAPQTFLLQFTPTAAFAPVDAQLQFDCANTAPAPVTSGLNTVLLSASATPVPDIVALGATPSGDGVVVLNSAGVFAVATVNVGVGGTITASAVAAPASLPLTFSICRTNPATGHCLASPTAATTVNIGPGETHTFSVFVKGSAYVPFRPDLNRITLRFRDAGGVTRGATSVAARSGSLSGDWRVTLRGTVQFDGGGTDPLVPATLQGPVTQQGNALSGTLFIDGIAAIVGGLPPGCSISCPTPGACTLTCGSLLACTFTCAPATTRCTQPLDLTGTAGDSLIFSAHGSAVVHGSCAGAAGSGAITVDDTIAVNLSGSPITLTGAHNGRDDRSCSSTGIFVGSPCQSFAFSGTYDQSILTATESVATGDAGGAGGALGEAITRALERFGLP